jgi:hypothetical protein
VVVGGDVVEGAVVGGEVAGGEVWDAAGPLVVVVEGGTVVVVVASVVVVDVLRLRASLVSSCSWGGRTEITPE